MRWKISTIFLSGVLVGLMLNGIAISQNAYHSMRFGTIDMAQLKTENNTEKLLKYIAEDLDDIQLMASEIHEQIMKK